MSTGPTGLVHPLDGALEALFHPTPRILTMHAFHQALLCKAALEAPWHVPCGGVCYGDDNLVFIANDWHTALLPVYLEVTGKCTIPCSALARHAADEQ